MFCHISGAQTAPNDMWTALEKGEVKNNIEEVKKFWTPNDQMSKFYQEDVKIVTDALSKVVLGISSGSEKFNKSIAYGLDGKEPCYYLTQYIRKGSFGGQTDGYRRRNEDGTIGPQK